MHYTQPDVYEFISKQTDDPIVERKTCAISGTKFPIYQSDLDFYDKISPVFGGTKFAIPTPTLCPEERARRRLTRRNERKLYKRVCDATHQQIISIYKPASPYVVYSSDYWRGDGRNPLDYGLRFDSTKTFAEQFALLMQSVPQLALIGANNENSPYINLTADCKNCYMLMESSNCEDCYHSYRLQKCESCVDSSFSHACRHCYEIDNCEDCYDIYRSRDCKDCSHSWLLQNCTNCQHCFGCVNLVNTQYALFNKVVSKEEREEFLTIFQQQQDVLLPQYREEFTALMHSLPVQTMKLKNTEGTYGHYLRHCENCVFCVDGYDAQDCKYAEHVRRNAKDVMDASTVGRNAERVYETINAGIGISNYVSCAICRSCTDMYYCFTCFNSHHCFGCVGLKNKSYCIFNKQYTPEEREQEVSNIIGYMQTTHEWGEFFAISLSPFAYNESCALEQYPLDAPQAEALGSTWMEEENTINLPDTVTTMDASLLPKLIQEAKDDIPTKIILCEVSKRPYRIIQQEVDFCREHNIPLPTKHPDVRHKERLAKRPGRMLYMRTCDKTGEEIASVYPQDVPFKVYSEQAYQQAIYS